LGFDVNPNYTEWHSIPTAETVTIPYEEIQGYDHSATEAWIVWVLEIDKTTDSITIA